MPAITEMEGKASDALIESGVTQECEIRTNCESSNCKAIRRPYLDDRHICGIIAFSFTQVNVKALFLQGFPVENTESALLSPSFLWTSDHYAGNHSDLPSIHAICPFSPIQVQIFKLAELISILPLQTKRPEDKSSDL
jgi:hypothetical protein